MRDRVFPEYRTMPGELQLDSHVGFALHVESGWEHLHPRPALASFVAQQIARVEFLKIKVLLIHAEDCPSPRNALVVAVLHTGSARFGGANDVPPWSHEVHDIAQRRRFVHGAVRVITDERAPRGG